MSQDKPQHNEPIRDASRPGAVRLQRWMADSGVASRRRCEELIREGKVRVNGQDVWDLPAWVVPSEDKVEVSGETLAQPDRPGKRTERLIYVMLYKPRYTVSTTADPDGRRTVLELVQHPSGVRLYPVGRLDYDTTGLVLMTNDGELANGLTHPRYGVHKTYRAIVKGLVEDDELRSLEEGVYLAERREGRTVGAQRTARVEMEVIKRDRDRTILDITLREGRNRQVRRMLAKVGHPVKKLTRTAMGPLRLKGLRLGEWRELTREEIQLLRRAVKGLPTGTERGPRRRRQVRRGSSR